MNFRDYLNFIFGNAFRMPFIKITTAVMITVSLGAMLVGMLRRKVRSAPPDQQRKAA